MGRRALSRGWEGCTEKGTPVLGLFSMNQSWAWDQGGEKHSRLREQHIQCLEPGEIRAHSRHMDFGGGAGPGN